VISDQLDVFPGHERFVSALLGLLAGCETFLMALEPADKERQPASEYFIDCALGVVSLTRTLRAVLCAIEEPDIRPIEHAVDAEGVGEELEGLLR